MLKNENCTRRIDDLGRVVIPKSLRAKYNIKPNDELEIFTLERSGRNYICLTSVQEEKKEKYAFAIEVLRELGLEIPKALEKKLD